MMLETPPAWLTMAMLKLDDLSSMADDDGDLSIIADGDVDSSNLADNGNYKTDLPSIADYDVSIIANTDRDLSSLCSIIDDDRDLSSVADYDKDLSSRDLSMQLRRGVMLLANSRKKNHGLFSIPGKFYEVFCQMFVQQSLYCLASCLGM